MDSGWCFCVHIFMASVFPLYYIITLLSQQKVRSVVMLPFSMELFYSLWVFRTACNTTCCLQQIHNRSKRVEYGPASKIDKKCRRAVVLCRAANYGDAASIDVSSWDIDVTSLRQKKPYNITPLQHKPSDAIERTLLTSYKIAINCCSKNTSIGETCTFNNSLYLQY